MNPRIIVHTLLFSDDVKALWLLWAPMDTIGDFHVPYIDSYLIMLIISGANDIRFIGVHLPNFC